MTTRPTPKTWAYGELATETELNEQIRDLNSALWVFTSEGQIALSTASNTLSVLNAASNQNKKIVSNGTTWIIQNDTRYYTIGLNKDIALQAGDNAARFRIPPDLDGFKISYVAICRSSGSGTVTIQLRNVRTGSDILSTRVTMTGTDSIGATAYVINTANDDVLTGDQIAIDVDGAGTSSMLTQVQIGLVRY